MLRRSMKMAAGRLALREPRGCMDNMISREVREEIISLATAMARSGQYARCIDIEAELIPQFGYQALRADFRSPSFQNDIEHICCEAMKRVGGG